MAFTRYDTVTVTGNSALLPSTQTDFPVLYSLTDNDLKTTGNGGYVENSSGYDIRFFSDAGLSVAIPFELEYYDGAAGTVVFWVKIASLALSGVFYVGFGDSALNTNASSTSTWNSDAWVVNHFPDGSTLGLEDSTANNYDLTNNAATAGAGKIDGGIVTASSKNASTPSMTSKSSPMTWSAWIKTSATGNYQMIMSAPGASHELRLNDASAPNAQLQFIYNGGGPTSSGKTMNDGNWHLVHGKHSGTTITIYVDGVQAATDSASAAGYTTYMVGGRPSDNSYPFVGTIDEARAWNVALSADWITAEYNSQNDPGTFLSHSFAAVGGGGGLGRLILSTPLA